MHLVTKMSPFELMLGKETKKPMDLTIPMIKVPLQRSRGDGQRA
jgi:hypothetical protein